VLLLPDAVDSFWVTAGVDYEGKPVQVRHPRRCGLAQIPLTEAQENAGAPATEAVTASFNP
jgi:molecular chaperone HtpG